MKTKRLALALCLAAVLCIPLTANAAKDVYDLGVLNVSAKKNVTEQTSVTNVITEEQIKATNSQTVAQALAYAPGVVVTTGKKNQPEVQIHGFDQSHILVLIDGVPYYETYYGKLNLDQIPSDIVSEIVITKGAPSVLYGAGAQVAVINVVTKQGTEKLALSFNAEAGSGDLYKASLSAGQKIEKFNYWLNYTHREQRTWNLSNDYKVREGTIQVGKSKSSTVIQPDGTRVNAQTTVDSLWARLGYQPSDATDLFVNLHMIQSERGMPPSVDYLRIYTGSDGFSDIARYGKYNDLGGDFSGRHTFNDWITLKGKLFYHQHEDDYESYDSLAFTTPFATSTYKDYTMGGAMWLELDPCDQFSSRFSLHYKGDSHKSKDAEYLPMAEDFSYTGSSAVELEWAPLANVSVVGGVSYDWFNVDKAQENNTDSNGDLINQEDLDTPGVMGEWNPMIGVTWQALEQTRIFGSIAHKTRFPQLSQLYSSKSGNRDLDAEKSNNYTVGVVQSFGAVCDIELNGFYYDISDWISRDGPYTDSKYRNYGSIHIYGAEFGITSTPIERLKLSLYYTYTQAEDKSDGAVTDKVRMVPEHKVDISAGYMIPVIETNIQLTALFMGEMYDQLPTPTYPDDPEIKNSGYFLLNARISKKFCENFEAYVAANNLFDNDYETEVEYPGPGFNFWAGITASY